MIPFTQISEFFAHVTAETGIAAFSNVSTDKGAFRIDHDNNDGPVFLDTIWSKEDFDRLKESNSLNNDENGTTAQYNQHKKIRAQEKKRASMVGWRAQVESAMHHLGFTSKENAVDENPVFVSVDIESYEFNHSAITEIGISILDTYQLPARNAQYVTNDEPPHPNSALPRNNIPDAPKSRAEAILALIESHHFRINENRFLRNGTYVSDAADRFEFGSSEFISLKDAPIVVAKCFRHLDEEGQKRKIILVGHDVKTDINYLKVIGYDVTNISNLEIIDTMCMWKAVKWDIQNRKLNTILMELELEYWNLHNAGLLALYERQPFFDNVVKYFPLIFRYLLTDHPQTGNDAAYTLQAAIKMAEKGLPEQPETPEAEVVPTINFRGIVRAEDVEIGFMENDKDASALPIGWKAAKNKAIPIPAPTPAPVGDNSPSEGSPLSVNGDGW